MYVICITTTPNEDSAKKIGRVIVEKKLGACVNILSGIDSFYTWEGKIETGKEMLLIIKTKRSLIKKLKRFIESVHPYKVPEILFINILDGNREYLKWIDKNTE